MMKKKLLVAIALGFLGFESAVAQDATTGMKFLDAEQYGKAKEVFEQLANSTPTAENQFNLGYFFLKTKQPDLAKTAFEKGAGLDPKDNLNKVGLGAVALAKGDRATAKLIIDEALKASKNKNVKVLTRAGEAYTGYFNLADSKTLYPTTDPAEAVRILSLAVALDKNNADAYSALGDAFYLKGESGPAVSKYEDVLRIDPTNAKASTRIAKIYWGGKNLVLAQDNFKKAIADNPEFAPEYREYSDLFFYGRQYKNASKNFDLYLEKSGSTDTEDILRGAQLNFLADEFGKVLDKLKLLEGRPRVPIMDRMEGWSNFKQNNYDKAVSNLERFLASYDKSKHRPEDYKFLGQSHLRLAVPDTAKAVMNLEKAAEMDTIENGYKEIAAFWQSARRYDKAAENWEKAITRDKKPLSNDIFAYGQALYAYANGIKVLPGPDSLANRQMKRDIFLKADAQFDRFNKFREEKGEAPFLAAYSSRARANYFAYSREEFLENALALPHFQKYIEMAEKEGKEKNKVTLIFSYKVMGGYYAASKMKDDVKAKEYFGKVLELDPNDQVAKDFLTPPAPPVAAPTPKVPGKAVPKKPGKKAK